MMDKKEGHFRRSIDTLRKDLTSQYEGSNTKAICKKTIANWVHELEKKNLIWRHQLEFNGVLYPCQAIVIKIAN